MRFSVLSASFILLFSSFSADAERYTEHPKYEPFIQEMVSEHDYNEQNLRAILSQAEKKQSILDAISRPAERTKAWYEYREIFLKPNRINLGVKFLQDHKDTFGQLVRSISRHSGYATLTIISIAFIFYGEEMLEKLTTQHFIIMCVTLGVIFCVGMAANIISSGLKRLTEVLEMSMTDIPKELSKLSDLFTNHLATTERNIKEFQNSLANIQGLLQEGIGEISNKIEHVESKIDKLNCSKDL